MLTDHQVCKQVRHESGNVATGKVACCFKCPTCGERIKLEFKHQHEQGHLARGETFMKNHEYVI